MKQNIFNGCETILELAHNYPERLLMVHEDLDALKEELKDYQNIAFIEFDDHYIAWDNRKEVTHDEV